MGRKRSASSSRWLAEHFKDQFVQKAHKQKLRSRAYFKLDEIQKTDKSIIIKDLFRIVPGWQNGTGLNNATIRIFLDEEVI